jgi:hypothetical protein
MRPSFSEQLASADVNNCECEKYGDGRDKNGVKHLGYVLPCSASGFPDFNRVGMDSVSNQNLTSMDRLILFSIFLRSGVNPGTTAPGEPQTFSTMGAVGQDVGVIPPGPVK